MKFKTSDHVIIDYSDVGEGQVVVLLCGLGGEKEIWYSQEQFLLGQGYRVINLDARNQGYSSRTIKGRRIFRHAQDLYELLVHLDIKRFIAVGNSMGASTLFAYMAQYGCGSILGMIDIDQSPKMIADSSWPFGFKQLTWKNFPDYLKIPFGSALYHRLDDSVFIHLQSIQKAPKYDAHLNYSFLVDHAFQDWRDVVALMSVPLLVVAGENSPYFDPAFAEATARLAKYGEYEVIGNAGHVLMAEQPLAFNRVLLRFLKRWS